MCGRASINRSIESIQQIANISSRLNNENKELLEWEISENCCPGMKLPIVYSNKSTGERNINMMLWGLENTSRKDKITNARLETIDELQTFKPLLKNNRCVLIIDGFYEWKTVLGEKIPYYFFDCNNDISILKVAALYKVMEANDGDNTERLGFTVLTSPSGSGMKWLHHRQPVLLSDDEMNLWLNCNEVNINKILPKLKESMENKLDDIKYHQVTPKLNSTSYHGKDCRIPKRSTTTPIANFFKLIKTPPVSPNPSQNNTTPKSSQTIISQDIFKSKSNNNNDNNNDNNNYENINSTTINDDLLLKYNNINNDLIQVDHIIINVDDKDVIDKILCPICNKDLTVLEINERNFHANQCTGDEKSINNNNSNKNNINKVKSPVIKSINNQKRKSNNLSPSLSKKKSNNIDTNAITNFFGIKK